MNKPEAVADVMEDVRHKLAQKETHRSHAVLMYLGRIERAMAASAVPVATINAEGKPLWIGEHPLGVRGFCGCLPEGTKLYTHAPAVPVASVPDGWRNVLQRARQGLGAGGAWGTPGSRQRELEVEIGGRLLDHIEDGLELLFAQPTTPEESP